ncbi:MAG: nuclear transport factor 2 family protein [Dehalococcoidia bacterium]
MPRLQRPADPATVAAVRDWFATLQRCVRAVDYATARGIFADDVVAFGTRAELVYGLDALEAQQWSGVWPVIEDFTFDLERLHAGADGALAWAVVPWTSTGFHEDGTAYDRPGRATVTFARHGGRWLALHTHFSLTPGTPHRRPRAALTLGPVAAPRSVGLPVRWLLDRPGRGRQRGSTGTLRPAPPRRRRDRSGDRGLVIQRRCGAQAGACRSPRAPGSAGAPERLPGACPGRCRGRCHHAVAARKSRPPGHPHRAGRRIAKGVIEQRRILDLAQLSASSPAAPCSIGKAETQPRDSHRREVGHERPHQVRQVHVGQVQAGAAVVGAGQRQQARHQPRGRSLSSTMSATSSA